MMMEPQPIVGEMSGVLKWFLYAPIADEANNGHPVVLTGMRRCKELVQRDYMVESVDNGEGQLCATYPPELLVPVGRVGEERTKDWTAASLGGLCERGRLARARTRFPIPVLWLYDGTLLLRSATLSVKGEVMLNGIMDFFGGMTKPQSTKSAPPAGGKQLERSDSLISRARWEDCKTLRFFGVRTICDLMKEHRKKKYGLTVTSSEKGDSFGRYAEFNLNCMPYPGTEGFVRVSELLGLDRKPVWHSNADEDAHLALASTCVARAKFCDWTAYTKWPLDVLTRNYLLLIMGELGAPLQLHAVPSISAPAMILTSNSASITVQQGNALGPPPPVPSRMSRPPSPRPSSDAKTSSSSIQQLPSPRPPSPRPSAVSTPLGTPTTDRKSSAAPPPHPPPNNGVLVHCISGWDRTPLFVSLLRMLAWAQGLAHQSLSAEEMLYFTVVYDWLLFRHRLADRMSKREEVMLGCFMFLPVAALDEGLVFPRGPPFQQAVRRERLLQLNAIFMNEWHSILESAKPPIRK